MWYNNPMNFYDTVRDALRTADGTMGLRKMDDGSMGEFDWSSDSPKTPRR